MGLFWYLTTVMSWRGGCVGLECGLCGIMDFGGLTRNRQTCKLLSTWSRMCARIFSLETFHKNFQVASMGWQLRELSSARLPAKTQTSRQNMSFWSDFHMRDLPQELAQVASIWVGCRLGEFSSARPPAKT